MAETIAAIFETGAAAKRTAQQIAQEGLKSGDISIVALGETDRAGEFIDEQAPDGTVTGGTVGGVAGLVLGMGTIAIPGLGVLAAAGPIAGLLTGAVTGGIVGSLVDVGIPEPSGMEYQKEILGGHVLLTLPMNSETGGKISQILKMSGASHVEVHRN